MPDDAAYCRLSNLPYPAVIILAAAPAELLAASHLAPCSPHPKHLPTACPLNLKGGPPTNPRGREPLLPPTLTLSRCAPLQHGKSLSAGGFQDKQSYDAKASGGLPTPTVYRLSQLAFMKSRVPGSPSDAPGHPKLAGASGSQAAMQLSLSNEHGRHRKHCFGVQTLLRDARLTYPTKDGRKVPRIATAAEKPKAQQASPLLRKRRNGPLSPRQPSSYRSLFTARQDRAKDRLPQFMGM